MGRATRKALAWRVSNTLHADFCIEALEATLARHGRAGISNSDHGSPRVTGALQNAGVRICLHAFGTGSDLRAGLRRWVDHSNAHRPHSTLGTRPPNEIYAATDVNKAAA
ncbi:integrase core domain-containing protein [uncultured Albimonas sp.]|mgnify:CR=1 FL=1|uniref:integrase core domain-containing protein n=1 Tax=uncultured Albimonas sp. TaxID=1331701 RepID=UPI0030EF4070|tara:strand:- start:64 stop:393 length:330 start_codon:yes stop_codon:yes gene_type:complete